MFSRLWQKLKKNIVETPKNDAESASAAENNNLPDLSVFQEIVRAELAKVPALQSNIASPALEKSMSNLTGIEHHKYLLESIQSSERQLVILSGWLARHVIDDVFLKLLSDRLKHGVSIYIGYGFQDRNGEHKKFGESDEVLETLKNLVKKFPAQLFIASYATHEKLLVIDDKRAVIGSANWLSNRWYRNAECSVIIENVEYAKSAADRAISLVKQHRIYVEIPKPEPKTRPKSPAPEYALTEEEEELLVKLKTLRSALAKRDSIAAFRVFSDKVLIEMAIKAPKSRDDMLEVKGVGKSKFESFGAEFIEIIEKSRIG